MILHSIFFLQKGVKMAKLESRFQSKLIDKLRLMFPGCIILKNDAGYLQGIADLLILWNEHWAALECKRSADAPHRPNQDYYIDKMNDMSFACFIYPENEEEILNEIQEAFRA